MILVMLVILGVCFGSFINAYIWRLHEQQKPTKKRKSGVNLSIVNGRSVCTHCSHVLAPADLIPIVSWLMLRGRCRYCHKAIDDTPIPELILPLLFVLSYWLWPYGLQAEGLVMFTAWLLTLIGLVALVLYDMRWMLLPNKIVYPLTILQIVITFVVAIMAQSFSPIAHALLGAIVGGGIFYVLFQVSDGKWIGGGDVKLGFLLGILVAGPVKALLVIFLASLFGTLFAMPRLVSGKLSQTSRLAFGPFLILGGITVFLLGDRLIDWYVSTFI